MSERDLWKYCTREQCHDFLLSLNLTGGLFEGGQQNLPILYELSNHPEHHYKKAVIPKKSGGTRTLWMPDEKMAFVQRRLLHEILEGFEVSPYAAAYQKGKQIRDHALVHQNKKMVVKLDIRDFFGSISWIQVYQKVFRKTLFPSPLRRLFTGLCCFQEALPQGAPTSPAVSNLVMRSFDDSLGAWCSIRKISYTRYCDDLTFSGDFDPGTVIRKAGAFLEQMGFSLNEKKTHVFTRAARQEVTGIVVNDKLQVPGTYRRKLRQECYYCRKYGVKEHMERTGKKEPVSQYVNCLLGRIQYVLQIHPEDEEFQYYQKELRQYMTENFKLHQ